MTTMLRQKQIHAKTMVENSSSDCSDMRRSMKAVTFFPHVLVKPTTHLNDYSPQELGQTFYCEADYKTMRKECMSTLKYFSDDGQLLSKRMQKARKTKLNNFAGGATDRDGDDALCFRGLEYRTPRGQRRRIHFKYQGLDTVLDLQEALYAQYETVDQEALAKAYADCVEPCRTAAYRLGLEDSQEAHHIYHGGKSSSLLSAFFESAPTIALEVVKEEGEENGEEAEEVVLYVQEPHGGVPAQTDEETPAPFLLMPSCQRYSSSPQSSILLCKTRTKDNKQRTFMEVEPSNPFCHGQSIREW